MHVQEAKSAAEDREVRKIQYFVSGNPVEDISCAFGYRRLMLRERANHCGAGHLALLLPDTTDACL